MISQEIIPGSWFVVCFCLFAFLTTKYSLCFPPDSQSKRNLTMCMATLKRKQHLTAHREAGALLCWRNFVPRFTSWCNQRWIYVTPQKISQKSCSTTSTITLEQELLWDAALVAVINLTRSTTGNPIMKITLELEDSGRSFYAWASFFSS